MKKKKNQFMRQNTKINLQKIKNHSIYSEKVTKFSKITNKKVTYNKNALINP